MTVIFKNKNRLSLGDNYIPPDGGWGWLVCIAGGLSLLLTFSIRKTFGLIFREKFQKLGITNTQITTILNLHIAIALFQGFLYGPIYRFLSIRKVAVISAILIVFGIMLLAFVETFAGFVISFSIIYGLGTGFNKSATILSVNTYFQNLRCRAYSLTLTLSAMGPIIMPSICNALLYSYGVQGTVIIFSGIAMHAISFALLYQPVIWHAKKVPKKIYVINVNDRTTEISVTSLNTLNTIVEDSYNNINDKELKINVNETNLELKDNEINSTEKNKVKCKFHKSDLELITNEINCPNMNENSLKNDNSKTKDKQNLDCFKNFTLLFDLDLLCDISYLNIIFGFAFSTVSELNSSLLAPFFLADFGFTNNEIAIFMSITAFTDLITRLLLPYLTIKIKWSSKIFYLIAITGTTIIRIGIAQNPPYYIHLILFSFQGVFSAIRSVYTVLVLSDYLPLEKLPAGTGLQQIPSGLFALAIGPVIGLIRDATNYSFVLYVLSSFSALTVILWTMEILWIQMKRKFFK